jgi:hypothetical protein
VRVVAVDLHRAEAHRLGRGGRAVATAAQDGADARQQLARLEGLGQVVVGAELQADDPVHRVALGGEHQHRHLAGVARQRAHAAAHFQAVDVRQHQVQHHQVGRGTGGRVFQQVQAGLRVDGVGDTETRSLEVLADHLGQAGVVFDHQELLHGWMLLLRPPTRGQWFTWWTVPNAPT